MQIKFSEDVVPLTDLKINPGKIVNQIFVRLVPPRISNASRCRADPKKIIPRQLSR